MTRVIVAEGGRIQRTEKRGVVWPRQYELGGSHFAAVGSFLFERDVERKRERERGRHPCLLHGSVQLDRMGEERDTEGEGVRKGRRYRMKWSGKVFPSVGGKAFLSATHCTTLYVLFYEGL